MQPKSNLPPGPNVSFCPSCRKPKSPNDVTCSNCGVRSCPKGHIMTSRICSSCGWKDLGFRQQSRAGLTGSESEATTHKIEYECGRCGAPVADKYGVRCTAVNCGYMGPHRFRRAYDKTQLSTVTTPQDVASSTPKSHSIPAQSQQQPQPASSSHHREYASSQLQDVASKEPFLKSITKDASVFEKTSAQPRRDWDYQSTESSKVKKAIVSGVLTLVVIAVVMFLFMVRPNIPQTASSTPSSPTPSPQTKPPIVEIAAPTISSIRVSEITESSVVISWVTNEKATSQVEYGTTTTYGISTEIDAELRTEHRMRLNALNPNTLYHFKVSSKNASGKAESSTDRNFTTAAPPDTTPPLITGIKIIDVSDTTVTIAWMTDEKATSQIEYGTSTSYGSTTSANENLVTNHTVTISGLESDKSYYFKVKSSDAKKNEAVAAASQPFRTQAPVPTGPEVGKRAPDFTVYTIDGAAVTLSQLRGKIVMVNFWTIGCGACVAEMPDIEAVYKTWAGTKGLRILAINAGDHPIYIRNFIQEQKTTLPIFIDPDRTAVRDYQISLIPRTFFIDSSGIIRKIQLGSFDNQQQIKEALDALP